MNKEMDSQEKWEQWAASLHGEDLNSFDFQETDEDKKTIHSLKKLHQVREQVAQVQQLQPELLAWDKLKNRIDRKSRNFRLWLNYAAVAVISILATGLGAYFMGSQFPGDQYAAVSCPKGQITNVTLFDGTNIWLNSGSTLKYPKTFNEKEREVYLEGEALFEVAKNKKKLFVVHTADADIKVHGTVFDVKAYREMTNVETVLIEGSVEFVSGDKSVFMKPGEKLKLNPASDKVTVLEVNTTDYTAWKGGKIYFNNETLENLTIQLERWYEVKFRFGSEGVKNFRFSGVINKDKSLDYTLNIIQSINKVEFEKDKEEVLIQEIK
jgi:transmembrane sensor